MYKILFTCLLVCFGTVPNTESGSGELYLYHWTVLRIRIWDPGSGAFLTPGSGIRDGYKFRIRIRNTGCSVADPYIFLPGSEDISSRSADPVSVLLIRDVYPESRFRHFCIQEPNFSIYPVSASKNLSILNQNNGF